MQVARSIFQRMQNFLTYRIAASLSLVFYFTIALFALKPRTLSGNPLFDDYFSLPVILLMLITILNDGTIIAIGYDNAKPSQNPAKWNLRVLFLVSTVLGSVTCFSALLLTYFALESCSPNSLFERMGLPCMPYPKLLLFVWLEVRPHTASPLCAFCKLRYMHVVSIHH